MKTFFGILSFILIPLQLALGVDLSGIYTSSCNRVVGVILNVNDQDVEIVSLAGKFKSIPRFDIIYIAQYSAGNLLVPVRENNKSIDLISIKTIYENDLVELVRGWMIDYSEEQISFLTLEGKETVIDIDDIFDIEMIPMSESVFSQVSSSSNIHFVHPYPFRTCNGLKAPGQIEQKQSIIFPQHLLEEPILIKKELDRMQEGYEQIRSYQSKKKFYPVPQIYKNQISLGMWLNAGSRHGVSKSRNNSFMPFLTSEFSEGPFGFQSTWVTGAAPMPYSFHEEPQTQLHYRMKSELLHFSVNFDLSRSLTGDNKYKWQHDELSGPDDRWAEAFHLAGGFDLGRFAFDLSITEMKYAIQVNDMFFEDAAFINKFGLFYRDRELKAELYYGYATDERDNGYKGKTEGDTPEEQDYLDYLQSLEDAKVKFYGRFQFFRLNLELTALPKLRPSYSLIYRATDFQREPGVEGISEFLYRGIALTNAFHFSYPMKDDLVLFTYFSLETLKNKSGILDLGDETIRNFAKAGSGIALVF